MLEILGENTDPPNKISISNRVAYFPNKWETDLAAEIPDVDKLIIEARDELGLHSDSGKPLIARYISKKLTSQKPPIIPNSIRAIIEKAISVKWEKCCLREIPTEGFTEGTKYHIGS